MPLSEQPHPSTNTEPPRLVVPPQPSLGFEERHGFAPIDQPAPHGAPEPSPEAGHMSGGLRRSAPHYTAGSSSAEQQGPTPGSESSGEQRGFTPVSETVPHGIPGPSPEERNRLTGIYGPELHESPEQLSGGPNATPASNPSDQ